MDAMIKYGVYFERGGKIYWCSDEKGNEFETDNINVAFNFRNKYWSVNSNVIVGEKSEKDK